jgi:hypothetical protein
MGILRQHRDIARIALTALRSQKIAGRYGLGGGNALLMHGTPCPRETQDVDVFIGSLTGFRDITAIIETSLANRGYTLKSVDKLSSLLEAWPEMGTEETGLAEWEVITPGGESTVQLQAGYFDLFREPVTIDGIPVIGLDDVAGHKTTACVNRQAVRDFADLAALMEMGYTAQQLVELAVERDQGLRAEDFAEALRHLDQLPDSRLDLILHGTGRNATWIREQLATWPRKAPPDQDNIEPADWA